MQRRIRTIVAGVAALVTVAVGTSLNVEAHEHRSTHRKLTAAALRLLNSPFLKHDPFLSEDQIRSLLVEGVKDEDECIGDKHGRYWGNDPNYNSHFYEAGTGTELDSIVPPPLFTGCDALQIKTTAPARAALLWERAKHDFHLATSDGHESAYYILGRVLHLMQDMTSPAHVHNDPHGWLSGDCGVDIDDFENWGHCDGGTDYISDYVVDSLSPQTCGAGTPIPGETPPLTLTCRLWWSLKRLYNAKPKGTPDSADPVVKHVTEENMGFAFVRHVAGITYSFTRFRVILNDGTIFTDEQPLSELRLMLRGSTLADCGAGVTDNGLCDVSGAWTISGDYQEIGRAIERCGRYEGLFDSRVQWWVSPYECSLSSASHGVAGFAYLENSAAFGVLGFVPLRYGCTAADSFWCGDPTGTVGVRSKELFQRLYGTNVNQMDPFEPIPHVGKTLLRIYGDVLYATAVAYGAGLIQTFIDEVLPTPADFDADGKSDFTVYRPSTGTWHTMRSRTGTPTAFNWGNSADRPVAGDFDGDGKADIAVFRPSNGTWYIVRSTTGVPYAFAWGNSADVPVPGDFDGDGRTDIAVFRPSNGTWYVVPSTTGVPYGFVWGNAADRPVAADYDGDARTDIAVFRPSTGTWYVVPSTTGVAYGYGWGNSADMTVPGDYDGDGKADIAVFRPSNGTWYIVPSTGGLPYGFAWGNSADTPVPGDYDGDGKTDIAVFRPSNGTWYVVPSRTGVPYGFAWGNGADVPIR